MNITTLLEAVRDAIHDDSATKTWCTTNYTRNHKVYVGADQRKPPAQDQYPLVGLIPVNKVAGYELTEQEHGIGITCGLYNEDLATTGKANVVECQGISHIEAFRKLVETAAVGAISSPQRVDEINIEYETLEFFPYFLVTMELKVTDKYYQGDDAFK